jgi:hypothetical protein
VRMLPENGFSGELRGPHSEPAFKKIARQESSRV